MTNTKTRASICGLACLFCLTQVSSSRAGEPKTPEKLVANFTMTRKISVLKESIESSGTLTLGGPGLLRWETKKPVGSVLVINQGKGWIHYPDLDVVKSFDISSDPVMKVLSEHLLALSRGNFNEVSQWYTVELADGGDRRLLPKVAEVRQLLSEIRVSIDGRGVVSSVDLVSAGGDLTTIKFEKIKLNPKLSKKLFAKPKE